MLTLRPFRATTVAVEKQSVLHILHIIFPSYLLNGLIFEKKIIESKSWFISLQTLSETFLILRRTGQDIIKDLYWSSCKVAVILVRF
jgi:hypothetical protein